MKNFLKIWWKELIFAVIALVVGIFIIGDSCYEHKAETVVEQTDILQLRDHLVDNIRSLAIAKQLLIEDSIAGYYKQRLQQKDQSISAGKKEINRLSKRIETLIVDYNDNPTLDKCDSALKYQAKQIDVQQAVIDSLDAEAQEWCELSESYERTIILKDTLLNNKTADLLRANNNINQLQKQIKRDNNWWKRNEKWFFLGAGAVGMGLILK